MGHLADFLAAVDKTTAAGLAMNNALGDAQASVGALAAENEALKVEIERLKAPAPAPVPEPEPTERRVNLWDLREGGLSPLSFFTHPANVDQAATGLVFRVVSGDGRSEMGLKDSRLDQVAKEPLGIDRIYRLRFGVPDGPYLENKVNLFQFWAKSGENPVFACELTRDRLRFVQKITGKIDRRVLKDIPFVRDQMYDVEVAAVWTGQAGGSLLFSVKREGGTPDGTVVSGPTTYDLTPVTFRWGAYCPSYLASNEPKPALGPGFAVLFSRVEVLEE